MLQVADDAVLSVSFCWESMPAFPLSACCTLGVRQTPSPPAEPTRYLALQPCNKESKVKAGYHGSCLSCLGLGLAKLGKSDKCVVLASGTNPRKTKCLCHCYKLRECHGGVMGRRTRGSVDGFNLSVPLDQHDHADRSTLRLQNLGLGWSFIVISSSLDLRYLWSAR